MEPRIKAMVQLNNRKMIGNKVDRVFKMVMMACLVMTMVSCRETIENIFGGDDITEGEEVMFTTSLPSVVATRATTYTKLKEPYEFTIGMYTEGNTGAVSIGTYLADTEDIIGTLKAKSPLYWPDTKIKYGFKATAGTETLEADQATKAKWLAQDRLSTDDQNTEYHTAKEWKAQNEQAGLVSDGKDYKKIPLNMYHKRSLITVILKAGEGVSRKSLTVANDLSAKIYSYGKSQTVEINPLAKEATIDYDADKNGAAATGVSTTRYDAIVEPYDYSTNAGTDLIAKISLSGQNYSFYADNDENSGTIGTRYNLEAGKHLTITATLGRASRIVSMSAYIDDWTEEVSNTICDDYGNKGEPVTIEDRDELIDFLNDGTKNIAGNVAILTTNINLDETSTKYPEEWTKYNGSDLNCTLNLGKFTLMSKSRFLNKLNATASILNGTIQIEGTVDAAVAKTNNGTIEDIKITAKTDDTHATEAGVVIDNTGTITKCSSSLKISGGSSTYVGGIAATSTTSPQKAAIIDACTVTNRVEGGTYGGGIVGYANGYVTNNTFEYGITLLQGDNYKNIVGVKNADHTSTFENNAWPTKATDLNMTNATAESSRYTGIIDSEVELKETIKSANNIKTNRYRLAKDIDVNSTIGSVAYELDGNKKKISTRAMIFETITGSVHDLTLYVLNDLTATQTTDGTDYMAPLAYEVSGVDAKISNVKVKLADEKYIIKASNPAGVVVWVSKGATVSQCEAKVNIVSQAPTGTTQGRKLAGGIVSTVSNGIVTQCILHSGSTIKGTESSIAYYGGIVGGIWLKEGSGDTTELTITDCTSYVKLSDKEHYGSILGNPFNNSNEKSINKTNKENQGNWWPTDSKGVGGIGTGSDEAYIGKRNTIAPTEDTNW